MAVGEREAQLFKMCFRVQDPMGQTVNMATAKALPLRMWHERLVHQSFEKVRAHLKN